MSLCLVPECLSKNSATANFCQRCGAKLLFQERYRALEVIGQGGFGTTFLAVDEGKPSRPYCVIKQFLPSSQESQYLERASQLFKQEADRLDELGDYPQIPELLSYFNYENKQYLVQEYIDGKNLAEELRDNGVFDEAKIYVVLADLLQILQFIHSKQVIHRDIKPENIIRRSRDNKLVLVDFGAAKYLDEGKSSKNTGIIGTAEYAAPEQLRGETQFNSDLYSLGVTCLHLLTNVNPFDLFSSAENTWVWQQYLPPDNSISHKLTKILNKLVEPAVNKRYHSTEAVLRDLNADLIAPKPTFAASKPIPPPPVKSQYKQERVYPAVINTITRNQNAKPNTLKADQGKIVRRAIAACIALPYFGVIILSILGSLITGAASGALGTLIFVGLLAFWCRNIAINKKRDPLFWFLLAIPFPVYSLIILAVLPPSSK